MSLSVLVVSFLSLLCLYRLGESLEDGSLVHSGVFRDDLLFDLSWPGPEESEAKPSKDIPIAQLSGEEGVRSDAGLEGKLGLSVGERVNEETGLVKTKAHVLLAEDEYRELSYIDMRTGGKEEYRCVVPEIRSWEDDMVSMKWSMGWGVPCGEVGGTVWGGGDGDGVWIRYGLF